jgi:hypothetical protein
MDFRQKRKKAVYQAGKIVAERSDSALGRINVSKYPKKANVVFFTHALNVKILFFDNQNTHQKMSLKRILVFLGDMYDLCF